MKGPGVSLQSAVINMIAKILHAIRLASAKRREAKKETGRDPRWPAVRDAHLRKHPKCGACGGITELQVHHVEPFHLRPDLELEPSNLETLCMGGPDCHLLLGHGGSFQYRNPLVRKHTAAVLRAAGGPGAEVAMELAREEAKEARKK